MVITNRGHYVLFHGDDLVGRLKLNQTVVSDRTYEGVMMVYILPAFRQGRGLAMLLTAVRHEVKRPVLVNVGLYLDGAKLLTGLIKRGKVRASVLHSDGTTMALDSEIPTDDETAIVLEHVSPMWYDYAIVDWKPHCMVVGLFEAEDNENITTYRFKGATL